MSPVRIGDLVLGRLAAQVHMRHEAEDLDVFFEYIFPGCGVALGPGRDQDGAYEETVPAGDEPDHLARLLEGDSRLDVGAQRGTGSRLLIKMHVEHDLSRPCSHQPAITILVYTGCGSGNQAPDGGNDVVNRRSVTILDRLDPAVFGKHVLGDLNGDVDVDIPKVVVHAVWLIEPHDQIGLSERPFACIGQGRLEELGHGRRVRWISCGGASLGPCDNRRLLLVFEDSLVLERSLVPISGGPGGHPAFPHGCRHPGGPSARVLVGDQRPRCDLASHVRTGIPVTRLAVLLQDGQNVRIEGRSLVRSGRGPVRRRHSERLLRGQRISCGWADDGQSRDRQ